MLSYYQQAELARLKYETRLAEAEHARRFAHLRPQAIFHWPAWLRRLSLRRHMAVVRQPAMTNESVVAVRQQAC